MAGRGRVALPYDHLVATILIQKGCIELDTPLPSSDGFLLDTLQAPFDDPETLIIKRESVERFSRDSKELISIIFNSPAEIISCLLSPKTKNVSKLKIKEYLVKNLGWKRRKVDRCFIEIGRFIDDLD